MQEKGQPHPPSQSDGPPSPSRGRLETCRPFRLLAIREETAETSNPYPSPNPFHAPHEGAGSAKAGTLFRTPSNHPPFFEKRSFSPKRFSFGSFLFLKKERTPSAPFSWRREDGLTIVHCSGLIRPLDRRRPQKKPPLSKGRWHGVSARRDGGDCHG